MYNRHFYSHIYELCPDNTFVIIINNNNNNNKKSMVVVLLF